MVHYEANGSSIDISFEQGEVVSLKCNGKTISADVRLPLPSLMNLTKNVCGATLVTCATEGLLTYRL